jgi:hypothetical protein
MRTETAVTSRQARAASAEGSRKVHSPVHVRKK